MSTRMLPKIIIAIFFLLSVAPEVSAHVKWFVPFDAELSADYRPYILTETAVMCWIAIAMVIVVSSVVLDLKLPSLPLVKSKARILIVDILKVCTGLSLIMTATNGAIIAPHYQVNDAFSIILLAIEVVVGLLLMINRLVFYAALLLLTLYVGTIIKYDFGQAIEYWHIVGIALFISFEYCPQNNYRAQLQGYSVFVLRICTGLALIALGFSEKLMAPHFGESFVINYDWNFIKNLGMHGFSDRLFVLSAGVMEVVFGLILLLGTTTRLNVLVLSGFMLTSNVAFFLQGNNEEAVLEIIGHLPIIAIAFICVFFGSGQKYKFSSLFKPS